MNTAELYIFRNDCSSASANHCYTKRLPCCAGQKCFNSELGRHFTLQPGAKLLLKRLNLTGGFMGTNGGAVYLSGIGSNVAFIECAFVGNEVNNQSDAVFVSFPP